MVKSSGMMLPFLGSGYNVGGMKMELNVYDLYQGAKKQKVMLYYCGPIAHSSIEGVAHTLRRNLEYEEAGNLTTQVVFSIFIEQVQNTLNYSAENIRDDMNDCGNELRVGIVVIGYEEEGGYFICCGNRVYNRDIARLTENIEKIRNLNKDELKALYKERRRLKTVPKSKGAGLGLIEMARKASVPLEYAFTQIDEEFSFFTIKVVVGRS